MSALCERSVRRWFVSSSKEHSNGQDLNPAPRLDHFFSAVAARLDLWRDLSRAAQAWAANPASRGDAGLQAACNEALTALLPMEAFQAYPGGRILNAIKERVAGGDAMGAARLVQRVSSALMSRSYRSDAGEFEAEDDAPAHGARDAGRQGRDARPAVLRSAVRDADAARRAGPPMPSRSGSCGVPRTSSSTSRCSSARSRTRRSP